MPETWGFLGKARLQQLIGQEVLNRLETLLPALNPELNLASIYSTAGLASIFNAFSGASQLADRKFRSELFNSLPPDLMNGVLAAVGFTDPSVEWPQKVAALTKAWSNFATAEAMVEFLGVPKEFLPQPVLLPPNEIRLDPAPAPYKPLKDFQVTIFNQAMSRLDPNLARFVIQMPTGSGKTRTAMEIVTHQLNDGPDGAVVFWLAHSEELCEQAYDCFEEVWHHVARRPLRLIRCWGAGGTLPFEFTESAFIVGGFPKLHALLSRQSASFGTLAPRVRLVVVDEAHKVVAPTYNAVVHALMGLTTRVVGLTATPGRSAVNESENRELAAFFFNEIISLEGTVDGVLEMLRKKGILSHTEYLPLKTSRMFELTAKEKQYLEEFFDLAPGVLKRMASDDVRNVEIVRCLQRECDRGGQILFFACSVEHSKFICALLNFLGITAVHLDGTTNRARRQSLIADFRAGKVKVMCNYGLLSTGFDAPKTDVVFIARPTASIVLYSQMIGRGLRGPAIGGTEHCRVIDVIDNIEGFPDSSMMYHYFDGYYDLTSAGGM